ncbi:UNVERIFIED_CONTAM: hypothetical protein K2H54_022089 [Gekko kuhli]
MKLLILLCCVLSTAFAVPVRVSRSAGLGSRERLPILISQMAPPLPQLPGFMPFPPLTGPVPFTQVAMPQQAAQNFYGFPIGGRPPLAGGMPPLVGGMPPLVGGMPPPVGVSICIHMSA